MSPTMYVLEKQEAKGRQQEEPQQSIESSIQQSVQPSIQPSIQSQPIQQPMQPSPSPQSAQPSLLPPPSLPHTVYRKLPTEFIRCQKEDLITIISRMLASLIEINDRQTAPNLKYIDHGSLTRFHSRSPPQISVFNYLYRLAHYSSLEHSILITAVYYIDLLTMCYPVFAINSLTVHRFLLTATTVAAKSLCDSFCSNHHYAKVGGVNSMELNLLEAEFLTKVSYRVVPRDFNYDSVAERRSSTGTLDTDGGGANSSGAGRNPRYGIGCAAEILDLYYKRMVMLVGGMGKNGPDGNSIMVGRNDNVVYYLSGQDKDQEQEGADGHKYFGYSSESYGDRGTPAVETQYFGNGYVDSSTDYDSSSISDTERNERPTVKDVVGAVTTRLSTTAVAASSTSGSSSTNSRKRRSETSANEDELCMTPSMKKVR
ncbi:DEKNAAC105259 [Brettanomyces naardenensis]|uniref:DEKNAAC105259 n=1 Tax=Brettanomyces naardenensis TaxID=13370 RepID=A0A448YSN3_BRENA|nr:DEKNAAC105259 [Brettanomyces naardenensis]